MKRKKKISSRFVIAKSKFEQLNKAVTVPIKYICYEKNIKKFAMPIENITDNEPSSQVSLKTRKEFFSNSICFISYNERIFDDERFFFHS